MKSNRYVFAVAWTNPVEESFVQSFKKAAKAKQLSLLEITYNNLEEMLQLAKDQKLRIQTFFDRASLDDAAFFLLAEKLHQQGVKVINSPSAVIASSSKANLQELYQKAGLPVAPTIIISFKTTKKEVEHIPKKLGVPFVLKPSHGGSGERVNLAAKNTKDIQEFIDDLALDKGLAQAYMVPKIELGKTAWFRPVYAAGEVIPLWWNPGNHFYQEFGNSQQEKEIARKLKGFVSKIASITQLDLFSCEIMITEQGKYIIIDHANHPIDLNTQETVADGLPPATLRKIVSSLLNLRN
jgi:hypothetical protein